MSKRVIKAQLNSASLNAAIEELEEYKKWLIRKTKEFLTALADEGVQIANSNFAKAVYDGTNDVTCSVEDRGDNKVAVVAVGGATLFIEFGTGIKYPDTHPEAGKHGMVRGQYGHKLGRLPDGWRYQGDPGSNGEVITEGEHAGEIRTYGNPANMCMYQTVRELEEKFEEIARRVYV